ncbi:site-specific recombinase, phage integrase family [Leptospira inadai serovar Lyme str. 10]|uniref:Site-specific recombinase, phage integrase family n=2 Tax=Leptospira inadai serovar Lyme TaxID=293084 RepID=V6H9A3_9LEPT|nr:tyrosine-type recombinase/integrase [Leptospira inadai]EQA35497.1 site-specific recombinase, phage integrase family [Leptospira inadai serovar Lyme str. 10]PNV73927.1 recombinase XerD [Leptospira inadai serovar Lyme]
MVLLKFSPKPDRSGSEHENDPGFLTIAEMRRLFQAAKSNENHYLWIQMIYSFGLFITELVSLEVRDLDWTKNQIMIQHSKKLKSRTLTIPLSLQRDLWLATRGKSEDAFLFSGRGGQVHPRTIQKMFSKLEKACGLAVSVIRIRRSLAVHLIEAGWGMEEAREYLGFTSKRSVQELLGPARISPVRKIFPLEEILRVAA